MIRLNCFYKANEGEYEQALNVAKKLVECSRKHQGCLDYDVFESATRKDVFVIVESWTDADALAAHAQTTDYKTYSPLLRSHGTITVERFTT